MLIIHADGGCKPNPGQGRFGVVAHRDGRECYSVSHGIGYGTNNKAEWRGAIAALTFAATQPDTDIELRMDSRLVVKQFNGQYRVKHADLKPLADIARGLGDIIRARGARVTVRWVPREQNTRADALAA
ncbi:MAG: ribonuclease HI family protein [Acidobacteriota bacterium]|nr:ribonuclease HI family protein [Acidobacteriota bacterium]